MRLVPLKASANWKHISNRKKEIEFMDFTRAYFSAAKEVIDLLDIAVIENLVKLLAQTREDGGRLFVLGVGGGAANASHAVNDFRKLAGMEAYAPTDNVSELTARVNDDGWETVFVEWLRGSRLRREDMLFIFSVGGGSLEKNISANLVRALQYAKEIGTRIGGVVGRDGGYTAQVADVCVVVPNVNAEMVTPLAEAFQAVVWHLIVSHPGLKVQEGKWESAQ
jgi:D-sedoheptulose 7-phosphate isomerase